MAAVSTPNIGVVDDRQTLKEAHDWIRLMVQDGLRRGLCDGIGQDQLFELEAKLREMRHRVGMTGLLRFAGEDRLEHARRTA